MASIATQPHPQDTSQTQSLPLFDLPPELRRLIWKHTLPGSRIHKAVYRRCCGRSTAAKTHIISPKPPKALSICKESRNVALETFKNFALCQCAGVGELGYFNPQTDILHIDINSPCEEWFAPWSSFSLISVAVENDEHDYEILSSILCHQPIISHVYLAALEIDAKMTDIVKRKRSLRRQLEYPEILIRATRCVPIKELEVVDGEKSQYKELVAMASSMKASKKHQNVSFDVVSVKVCCCCP